MGHVQYNNTQLLKTFAQKEQGRTGSPPFIPDAGRREHRGRKHPTVLISFF